MHVVHCEVILCPQIYSIQVVTSAGYDVERLEA